MKYLYALIFSLFFSSVYAAERQLQCKVVGISDGDTLTCLVNKTPLKIRLQHIDAPEQAQPYGNKAKQALAQFVFQQNITAIVSGYDRYQRLLATLYLNDKNINLALVENGMAWAYTTSGNISKHKIKHSKLKSAYGRTNSRLTRANGEKHTPQPYHKRSKNRKILQTSHQRLIAKLN